MSRLIPNQGQPFYDPKYLIGDIVIIVRRESVYDDYTARVKKKETYVMKQIHSAYFIPVKGWEYHFEGEPMWAYEDDIIKKLTQK